MSHSLSVSAYIYSTVDSISVIRAIPPNTTPRINAGLMLVQPRRRWTKIKPALVQGVVFSGVISWYILAFDLVLVHNGLLEYSNCVVFQPFRVILCCQLID